MVGKGQGEMFQEELFDLIGVNFLANSQKKIFLNLLPSFDKYGISKKLFLQANLCFSIYKDLQHLMVFIT